MKNTENKLNKIIGPIKLPLEIDNHVDYHSLYYFEYNNERWACVCYGDLSINKPIPLRIESACFFGHVFHSRQCDCGYQLMEAFSRIRKEKFGLVIYGIDQDARGLGIEAHYKIYDYRQNLNLDTEEVFEKLHAKLDNRNYNAVAAILKFININKIKLLSNNPSRISFLKSNGFEVVREEIEAPLDKFNMATIMLEKEDLAYQWSFLTHAYWLAPIQESVQKNINKYAGRIVESNKKIIAEWIGDEWSVANNLCPQLKDELKENSYVVYLTDYPRLDELKIYAAHHISLIVAPFSCFPEYLVQEAKKYGIKLQDWARENKYKEQRNQWSLIKRANQSHIYERGDTSLTINV